MQGEAPAAARTPVICLGALASGALYALAFPPAELFPLAWIALVPLVVALCRVGPWAGAGLGLVFSLGAGAGLASWLPGTLAAFFQLGWGEAVLYAFGVLLLCGLPYAAFGACVAAHGRRPGLPLVVAACWGFCEWLRLAGPIPTPWALLAYTQAPWLPIVQSADLFGALGLGVLMASVNGSVAAILMRDTRGRRFTPARALPFALVLAAWIYGGVRLAQPFGTGDEISVALVQAAVAPSDRFVPARREANLERHLALTRKLAAAPPDLVIWPELSVEFHVDSEPALWQRVEETQRALGSELLVGAPHSRYRALVLESTNAALLVRDGRLVDQHEKVALMPFSETRPALLPIGRDLFRPGRSLRPLHARAGALGVLLCSEGLQPELAQRLVAGGAELLANPSNDDWFASEAASRHQLAVSVFRAVETRRPWIRPSTRGLSSIVDAHGRILALAPYGEPALLEARVRRGHEQSAYSRLSQRLPGPASGITLAFVFGLAVLRRRDP
ncbi:MAG TPA: apolipoprotein N-acyltransferase [Myxococcota bacterium]|nr:apolipoprotein N-acyltransferase [Myxococcota bacterium]